MEESKHTANTEDKKKKTWNKANVFRQGFRLLGNGFGYRALLYSKLNLYFVTFYNSGFMKRYIWGFSVLLAFLCLFGMPANSQVAINGSGAAPAASAMLDITSTSSGMLVPRMTSAQRTAIASPATTSLLVFQTDGTAGFYYYTGAAWQYLNTQWTYSGTNIAFPVGSVGINTASPNASAVLDVTSTTSGMLVPRMTTAQRTAIASPASSLIVFQTDGTAGFYYYKGAAWQYLNTQWTYSGANIVFASGSVGMNGTAIIGANGTAITQIIKTSGTVTVGNVGIRLTVNQTFAIANTTTNSSVLVSPLNALPATVCISYARVSAPGTVTVAFSNFGTAAANVPAIPITLR